MNIKNIYGKNYALVLKELCLLLKFFICIFQNIYTAICCLYKSMVNELHSYCPFLLLSTIQSAFIAHIHTLVVEATLQGASYSSRVINIHMNTHIQWKSHQQQFGVQYLA